MAKKTLAEKMAENSKAVYEGIKTHTIGTFSSTESIKKNIVILDELRDLIPPLLVSEHLALKENLQKHGCKDPLKIWQTTNKVLNRSDESEAAVYVLIDGHNRYQLCNELQIPFNIQIDNFESFKEVRDFMIDFQLSRRNITPQQASYLRGLRYNTEKKEVSDNLKIISTEGKNDAILPDGQNVHLADLSLEIYNSNSNLAQNSPNGQNVHLENKTKKTTAQELGAYFKVDEKTIRRDAEFARGLEKLTPTFRKEILNGQVKVEKTKIQKIGKVGENIEPLQTIEEVNAVYNNLNGLESEKTTPQDTNLLVLKYNQLNIKLQKIYKSKKVKLGEIESLKNAFKEFIAVISK